VWQTNHVAVQGGQLVIRGYQEKGRWVTGGLRVTSAADGTPYGRYLVRFRIDKARGIEYVLLLWPDSERWPADGEVDFAEDEGGNRLASTASLVTAGAPIQRRLAKDNGQWHVMGVDWTPKSLVYTIDGVEWGRVSSPLVPTSAHHLAIQTQAEPCGRSWGPCPDATTPAEVDLQVDWVAIYRPV
jgi:beta-glucanase (GH16 family)